MDEQADLYPPDAFEPSNSLKPDDGGTYPRVVIPPPRRRRPHVAAGVLAAVIVVAAAGALVGHELWSVTHTISSSQIPSSPYATGPGSSYPGSSASGAPADTPALARAADPSLVDITSTLPYEAAEEAGTGMVLTSKGEILTNNHVIEGAGTITVTDVGNGKSYNATVDGYSRADDIAVLQLSKASDLTTIAAGSSSSVGVGDGVVAVGNAEGAGGTPAYSGGAITATGQNITAEDQANGSTETLSGLFQTNAQIVSGDSGGALVAASGKVIGMITAGTTGFRFQTTYGYAIPINQALDVARQIQSGLASATVHIGATAFLGVDVQTAASGTGAQIVQVVPGGPAAGAGLAQGDVITAVAGQSIGSPSDITNVMLTERPGQTLTVQYLDASGLRHTATVHLTSGPPQ